MTLKKFTSEGRFEAGLDDAIAGKMWAYIAIVGNPYTLGVAVANESGYIPIPTHWCNGDDYAEMDAYADELNARENIDRDLATRIIASGMAKGKVTKGASQC